MAIDPHLLWAIGHALLLVGSFKVGLSSLFFRGTSAWWYKTSFSGAMASYAIVCLKSVGSPTSQPPLEYAQKALLDENVQYLVLAVYWWISKPIPLTLLPYATFSLFHTLTFLRSNLIPKFFPPSAHKAPAAAAGTPASVQPKAAPERISRAIQLWVKANYDTAMKFVAYVELVILLRVTLGALLFQNSFLAPIFYAHFIRLRYYHSAFTRSAVDNITARSDKIVANQAPAVQKGYGIFKNVVQKWAGSILARNDGAAPAAAGTAPNTGRAR
ncbi:Uncharacterized integral membrane protein [Phaffia rhodozyma]|uniref:Uncharacterized integral membrane protein n=1 Tax=Phaffia rhodozyma TaxID=264483 RepID=A0A0F7SY06_PHARH|nr:Uncharacterized integral membrane protein [Phaffia rhodozyma]